MEQVYSPDPINHGKYPALTQATPDTSQGVAKAPEHADNAVEHPTAGCALRCDDKAETDLRLAVLAGAYQRLCRRLRAS